MIEKVAPGTMDKRKTNLRAKDIFNVMINHNAAIEAAKEAVRPKPPLKRFCCRLTAVLVYRAATSSTSVPRTSWTNKST